MELDIKSSKERVRATFERYGYELGEYLEFEIDKKDNGYSCYAVFEDDEEETKIFWFDLNKQEDGSLKMSNIKAC